MDINDLCVTVNEMGGFVYDNSSELTKLITQSTLNMTYGGANGFYIKDFGDYGMDPNRALSWKHLGAKTTSSTALFNNMTMISDTKTIASQVSYNIFKLMYHPASSSSVNDWNSVNLEITELKLLNGKLHVYANTQYNGVTTSSLRLRPITSTNTETLEWHVQSTRQNVYISMEGGINSNVLTNVYCELDFQGNWNPNHGFVSSGIMGSTSSAEMRYGSTSKPIRFYLNTKDNNISCSSPYGLFYDLAKASTSNTATPGWGISNGTNEGQANGYATLRSTSFGSSCKCSEITLPITLNTNKNITINVVIPVNFVFNAIFHIKALYGN